eukprot:GHVP01052940.1.p1 GENE.GHVP01052940.1~~GHVP01052940.1.p1  ORF type:complete len:208 (+),score=30.92 GHVP01052940.1:772-1395(+)
MEINERSLTEIQDEITSKKVMERLEILFNNKAGDTLMIDSPFLIPYLPIIKFYNSESIKIDLDIEASAVNKTETICLEGIKELQLYNKAFYLLPKIRTTDADVINTIVVDINDSEIGSEEVNSMKNVEVVKAEYLYLYKKAFYTLPKITLKEGGLVEHIMIDAKCSDIDSEIVNRMETIRLERVMFMSFYNTAFYLLPKIKRNTMMK